MDVEILLDRSGSMEGSSLNAAKKAASQFIDFMNVGDKVGVVSFANEAVVDYRLTAIDDSDPSTVQEAAKAAVNNLQALGDTSMGSGLRMAQDQLNAYGLGANQQRDPARAIILFSDGTDNTAPFVRDALPALIADDIRVCTIGIGVWSDKTLLQKIAQDTGCSYRYAPDFYHLSNTFAEIWSELSGRQMIRKQRFGIKLNQTVGNSFEIDSSVQEVTVSVAWEGSDMDLSLIAPDGTVIDASTVDPDVEFLEGETYEYFRIQSPMAGRWQTRTFGKEVPLMGERANLFVAVESALSLETAFDGDTYGVNERIGFTASVADAIWDLEDPQLVKGANIIAEVFAPNNRTALIPLVDDGQHADGAAGDGVYGGYFTGTLWEGSYNFTIKASGPTNREGDRFVREAVASVVVNLRTSPVAEAGGPYAGNVGAPIVFDASRSFSPNNAALLYRWDFDSDGNFDTEFSPASEVAQTFWNGFSGEATLEVKSGTTISTDKAPVTIYGVRDIKAGALADLSSLPAAESSEENALATAAAFIKKSLEEKWWQDDCRLKANPAAGSVVFEMEKAAALRLETFKSQDASSAFLVDGVLGRLANADEILVRIVVEERGGWAAPDDAVGAKAVSRLEKSQEYFVSGQNLLAAGKYSEAIADYHLAWLHLVQIGNSSGDGGDDGGDGEVAPIPAAAPVLAEEVFPSNA